MTSEQEKAVHDALLAFWTNQDEAARRQAERGIQDMGGRAGATAGGHLDRVAQMLAKVSVAAGAPWKQVYYKAPDDDPNARAGVAAGFTLPGYYRPTKQWDLVVHHDGRPIACIELKSQTGPSYGNNANNRAEEAVGNAVDLGRAGTAGLLPAVPWVGYVFVIEDDTASRKERGTNDRGFYPRDVYFDDWSYCDRIRLLCQRLVEDRLYDAAWAVATSRPTCRGEKCPEWGPPHHHAFDWRELDEVNSGYAAFVHALGKQIQKYYPDRGPTAAAQISLT